MKKGIFLGAVATGAAFAFYMHNKHKLSDSGGGGENLEEFPEHRGRPVSLLLSSQKNISRLTREILHTWFMENTDSKPSGKMMVVATMHEAVLGALGYEMDIALDTDHYLLLQFRNIDDQNCLKECVVNFNEIETELKELLDSGNGILKVNG